MQRSNKLLPQPPFVKNEGGYIMVIVVLILSTVISVILVQTAITSLGELTVSDVSLNSKKSYFRANGCLEEGLLQLNRDFTYSGGVFALPDGVCDIVIEGDAINKTISAYVIIDDYQVTMQAEVIMNPFELVSWGKVE